MFQWIWQKTSFVWKISEKLLEKTSITKTLDKILAGDAKFKVVKGNSLPELVSEYVEWCHILCYN